MEWCDLPLWRIQSGRWYIVKPNIYGTWNIRSLFESYEDEEEGKEYFGNPLLEKNIQKPIQVVMKT